MVDDPSYDEIAFEWRMKVLIDPEEGVRRDRKVVRLVRECPFQAAFACVEDVLYGKDRKLSKVLVLRLAERSLVDDFMTMPIASQNARRRFGVMEAREGRRATVITFQLEPDVWYLWIGGGLMADSILNCIATSSRYVDLDGSNMSECFARRKAGL